MNKKSKLIYTLGSLGVVSFASLAAVACSTNSPVPLSSSSVKIGGVVLADEGKKIVAVNPRKTLLITDAGRITDQSFNQSGWEGIWLSADQHNLALSNSLANLQPATEQAIPRQYQTAQSERFQNWFLPGFKHSQTIKAHWETNKAALKANNTVIVGVDFVPEVDPGYGIGIKFDVKQSAFIVGYAVADWLAKKYPSSSADDVAKRSVYTFGGGPFDAVTDFMFGFFRGIQKFNEKTPTIKTKILLPTTNTVDLGSGFLIGDKMTAAVTPAISSNATVILPVAGPATGEVLSKLSGDAQASKVVVGVDVDESISHEANKTRFFSSIMKRIAQSTYDVQTELYGPKDNYKVLKGFELGKTSTTIQGSIENNLVGYAPSTLATADKTLADASLAAGRAEFDAAKADLAGLFNDTAYRTAVTTDKGSGLPKFLGDLALEISK